jgi:hypothetical protein
VHHLETGTADQFKATTMAIAALQDEVAMLRAVLAASGVVVEGDVGKLAAEVGAVARTDTPPGKWDRPFRK